MIDTPGHTRGQINYLLPRREVLLAGDTLFSLGCGRLIEGTPAEMFASLRKLAALPGGTKVCAGHEYTEANAQFALQCRSGQCGAAGMAEQVRRLRAAGKPTLPSLLADELKANPFLTAPDVATFADRRARKDRF